jgi:TPR repeat protein
MKRIILSIIIVLSTINAGSNETAYQKYNSGNKSGAIKDWTKTCERGNLVGCFYLGLVHSTGDGVKQNKKKAKIFYKKSCDGGTIIGCNNLAYMYYIGDGVKKDLKKAKILFKKACDGKSIGACKKYTMLNAISKKK